MSLDVWLYNPNVQHETKKRIFIRYNGQTREITMREWHLEYPEQVPVETLPVFEDEILFERNITHNLNKMADAAGIYKELWCPYELGYTTAKELIEPLTKGLAKLKSDPNLYKGFNPKNGWGNYEGLVEFVTKYLDACKQNKTAKIGISN
jgi:hypothetical protein